MTRVLVTRPRRQAAALAGALAAAGLQPVCVPTVEIEPAADPALEEALGHVERFDWIVVTSANAVPALAGRLDTAARRGTASRTRIAAIGPATAAALTAAGLSVDHVPDTFLGSAIVAGLGELDGRHVLLAHADAAEPDLRETLEERGARVADVVAYHTLVGPSGSRQPLADAVDRGLDLITFASASAVRGLEALLDPTRLEQVRQTPAACIGPVTADQARAGGFQVAVVAAEHTAAGLAHAVVDQLAMEALA
jgi:uroporphyrinogen-III synthase